MQERTTGAISLRPTGNSQGAYLFMSLTTGRRLNFQILAPLPLPQDVTNVIHRLACHNPKGIDILDRDWHPFLEPEEGTDDDRDNSTYAPPDNDSSNN